MRSAEGGDLMTLLRWHTLGMCTGECTHGGDMKSPASGILDCLQDIPANCLVAVMPWALCRGVLPSYMLSDAHSSPSYRWFHSHITSEEMNQLAQGCSAQ